MEETKQCPYCGEEILATAKKCKHCGEWLDSTNIKKNKDEYRTRYAESTWQLVLLSAISSSIYMIFWISKQLKYINNYAKYQQESIIDIFQWFIVLYGLSFGINTNLWIQGINYSDVTVGVLIIDIPIYILWIIIYFKLATLYENYVEKTYNIKIHLNRFLVFFIAPFYINHTANTIEDRL